MPLYTFYPCRLDDTALGFEAFELDDDTAARERAQGVLADHASAAFVVAWCGDRLCSPPGGWRRETAAKGFEAPDARPSL